MLMGFDEFDALCNHLGFTHLPRSIGNPRQQFVFTTEDAFAHFSKWAGESSCFMSTQGYDNLTFDGGGSRSPESIHYGLTFFDFDHDTKPENAYADAHRLCGFLREHGIAHWAAFSGSKGYHVYIMHQQVRFRFSHRDGSADALRNLVWQIQNHLKVSLGLNTLDEQTMGDPKRLCRFPFTPHVDRHGVPSGKFCYALPSSEVLESSSHDELVQRSYAPVFIPPTITGDRLTIRQLVERLNITLSAPETNIRPVIGGEFAFNDPESAATRYVSALDVRCPGVVNELKRINPGHKARVHSALFAKFLGMTLEQFESVWVEMGTTVGYVDLPNAEYRRFQMESIFNNPRMRSFPSCTTLKRDGCCIGEVCPRWRSDETIQTDRRKVSRRWRPKGGSKEGSEPPR